MIAFIPARYESSRFPGKVLVEIGQKPLINIVAENAAKCDYISEVVVLTDDSRIEEAVKKVDYTKVRVVNGTYGVSGTDRAFSYMKKYGIDEPFVVIQADCPDLDLHTMNRFLASVIGWPTKRIHTLACELPVEKADDPNDVKVVFGWDHQALYFSRSKIPYNGKKFFKHIGVYAFPKGLEHRVNEAVEYFTATEDLEQLQWLMTGSQIQLHIADKFLRTVDVPKDYTQFSALTMK